MRQKAAAEVKLNLNKDSQILALTKLVALILRSIPMPEKIQHQ
jgi:hypothetical protein